MNENEEIKINEEENNILLDQGEENNNEEINNDKLKDDINKEIQDSLLNNNNNDSTEIKNDIINDYNNINNNFVNIQNNNEKKIISDYLVLIQYTKILCIPYFIFNNIVNFYCPFYKFKSKTINLSKMPTPPFTIVTKECK